MIGISLYPQGTRLTVKKTHMVPRYIPVPTGNAIINIICFYISSVYPCTHRERDTLISTPRFGSGISLYPQGTRCKRRRYVNTLRYIPVPTGNAFCLIFKFHFKPVYPCTHRERERASSGESEDIGISLYPQGTLLRNA